MAAYLHLGRQEARNHIFPVYMGTNDILLPQPPTFPELATYFQNILQSLASHLGGVAILLRNASSSQKKLG